VNQEIRSEAGIDASDKLLEFRLRTGTHLCQTLETPWALLGLQSSLGWARAQAAGRSFLLSGMPSARSIFRGRFSPILAETGQAGAFWPMSLSLSRQDPA